MSVMIEFVKGQQYTNRKGTYTVIDVKFNSLMVRYDDGAEETLDATIQRRILSNMTLPPRTPEPPPRKAKAMASKAVKAKVPVPAGGD